MSWAQSLVWMFLGLVVVCLCAILWPRKDEVIRKRPVPDPRAALHRNYTVGSSHK